MILAQVFNPKLIKVGLESDDKDEVFEELVQILSENDSTIDRNEILKIISERESKMSTGVLHGVALPHGRTDAINTIKGCIGISRKGIDYDALDKAPVHIVILLLTNPNKCEEYLQVLKRLALLLENSEFCKSILVQQTAQGVYDTVCKFENDL